MSEREREKKEGEDERGEEKGARGLAEATQDGGSQWGDGGVGGVSSVFCSELLKTDSVVQSDAADGLSCCTRLAGSKVCQRSDFFLALFTLDLVTVFCRFLSD